MTNRLREQWPWNKAFLRAFLFVPSIMGIAATIALYPVGGVYSLWFLTAILIGLLLNAIYGTVGRRVAALKHQYEGVDEVAEGLLVIGKIQSPGIAILRKSELELVPIAGQ
ncbi:MAG: hypothetical protein N2C12_06610, partial [Planctomycetales bacterium]